MDHQGYTDKAAGLDAGLASRQETDKSDFKLFSGTNAEPPPSTFSAGQVLSLTLSVLRKNPFFYFFLSFLPCLPGIIIKTAVSKSNATHWNGLVDLFLTVIFMGAISYGVYKNLTGERPDLGRALARGLSRYFSLFCLSLLYVVFLGFLAIFGALLWWVGIIGAVIVFVYAACAYAVITPACVVEKLGPIQSLARSSTLTKGHRISIFGLYFIYILCMVGVSQVKTILPVKLIGNWQSILDLLIAPISIAFLQVMIAVLYYQLRVDKEGVSVDKLAQVFD